MELVNILIIKHWSPNAEGVVAWLPLKPVVGDTIEVEKYTLSSCTYLRWPCRMSGFVDIVVPDDCFMEAEEGRLTVWDKEEI